MKLKIKWKKLWKEFEKYVNQFHLSDPELEWEWQQKKIRALVEDQLDPAHILCSDWVTIIDWSIVWIKNDLWWNGGKAVSGCDVIEAWELQKKNIKKLVNKELKKHGF